MYEVAYNTIMGVTVDILENSQDSPDSAQDASKGDNLPVSTTPDPVETDIKHNSSVSDQLRKDAHSIVNFPLFGSHHPAESPNYIRSPDYDPVNGNEFPQ